MIYMKVLVISESFIMRDSLKVFFDEIFNIEGIKTSSNLSCLRNEDFLDIDFLFIDINRKDINIVRHLSEIKNKNKNIKIMILDTRKDISLFLKLINHGIDGYILNITDKDEFIYIIRKVLNGKKFYDSELLQYSIQNHKVNDENNLTSRENNVLSYVYKGFSNKEIANELNVTDYTIKKHVSSILKKLNLRNRQELIRYLKDKLVLNEVI